ncbi:hypothetical protein SUGI_0495430 [Cryptomeria japonica]|nr:hypothetical protein SUGI_0495430 [Cryptomeria japonica]
MDAFYFFMNPSPIYEVTFLDKVPMDPWEAYVVPATPKVEAVGRAKLPKPIVFHDGRLVHRPTPILALITILWFPVGFLLACLRIAAGALLPMSIVYHAFLCLGVRVRINGTPPPATDKQKNRSGVLFICSHRTLLDPIFLSTAVGRPVSAVTYSVSRVSEILSPIKTVPLTRERAKDAAMIKSLLEEDVHVPWHYCSWVEGHGSFYFFMNPSPLYEVTFLDKVPVELTCTGGKSSHEVANYIQRAIAGSLSYVCTSFTRKDKYRALAGNDGIVAEMKSGGLVPNKVMGC